MSAWTCRSSDGKAAVKIVPPVLESHTERALVPIPKRSTSPRDIDIALVDSLKALDPERSIREADIILQNVVNDMFLRDLVGDSMTRFVVGDDRSQSTLFPELLDDYLGEDNPVRAIDVFVDELDLAPERTLGSIRETPA